MTWSTPGIPSSASARTPSGSPIAPMAVVSSPGMTFACTPAASSRSTTAAISAAPAAGVITTITPRSLAHYEIPAQDAAARARRPHARARDRARSHQEEERQDRRRDRDDAQPVPGRGHHHARDRAEPAGVRAEGHGALPDGPADRLRVARV